MKRALGYALLSTPFIALFGFVVVEMGWIALAKVLGITAAVIIPVFVGTRMVHGA